jgi:hypothetical protein
VEPVGGGRVEGGPLRRDGDGEGVGGDVDDGDISNKMLPVANVWTQTGYEVVPEVGAIGSSLERVLDVAPETMVLRGGSDENRGGQWWRSPVSRGGQATAESKSREPARGAGSGVEELSPCAHVRDKDSRSTWDGGNQRYTVTTTSPRAVSRAHAMTGVSRLSS